VNVIISPLPDAGFSASSACLNTPIQFNNSSVMTGGTITGYQWDFGDGSPVSSDEDPAHVYTNPGTYTVTLIVTNGDGCTDTITRNVFVNPMPVASFLDVNAAGCGPVSVAFMDASSIPGGAVVSWSWDFGDGTTSDQQNPTHAYTVSGSYAVSLTVTSDSGCTATYTQQSAITVYPSPLAEFEADPWVRDILDPQFNFINLSVGGLNYNWTFGDGQGSSLFEPKHTYRDTGDYMVTLWVTNAYGCTDSVRHPVRVNPIFSWWIPNAFTPNGDGNNEDFNVKGEYIANVELTIFNRWGEAIFYNEGKESAAWDGSVVGQSQPAKEDVYVFQVKLIDVWGKRHEKVGHVTLVR
jgi:gliding motility-associated-like protein